MTDFFTGDEKKIQLFPILSVFSATVKAHPLVHNLRDLSQKLLPPALTMKGERKAVGFSVNEENLFFKALNE
jgi:hypothetical protein